MLSKWSVYKEKAIALRRQGFSIREIEKKLGISRSTLSDWFKNVKLNKNKQRILLRKWKRALIKAREYASEWHRQEKQKRIQRANEEATAIIDNLDLGDKSILELAIAVLYLGEGTKKSHNIRMANSNPDILKMFIKLLSVVYGIDIKNIKCGLNLRYDQDSDKMKIFWSRYLGVPLRNITYVFIDKRATMLKTHLTYKGVCTVRCGNILLKRRIEAVGNQFCKKILTCS